MRFYFLFLFFFALCNINIHSQVTRLVLELEEGSSDGISQDVEVLGTGGNSIALYDNDQIILSDGSAEGTKVFSGYESLSSNTIEMNGKIYIRSFSDGYSLLELDPETQDIRTLVQDYDYIGNLIGFKEKLYFEVETDDWGSSFLSLDPNSLAIEKIFGVNTFGGIRDVVVHNELIYTIHWKEDVDQAYLSSTDGTPNNVNEFAFLHDGSDFSQSSSINMTSAGDLLYFFYYSNDSNYAMYVSDGSEEGTMVLQEGMKKIPFYDYDGNRAIGTIGNSIFFRGYLEDELNDHDLWISDGTKSGTSILRFLGEDDDIEPEFFTPLNDKLYFYGYSREGAWGSVKKGMIETDGTIENTKSPYNPFDHEDELYYTGWQMTSHNGKLFFSAESGSYGLELYSSDGDLQSIKRLSELAIDDEYSSIRELTSAGENLFFIGDTELTGRELYVYGSPITSTKDIKLDQLIISPNPADSYISFSTYDFYKVDIFNTTGSLVKTVYMDNSQEINIENLESGLYIAKCYTESQHITTSQFFKL